MKKEPVEQAPKFIAMRLEKIRVLKRRVALIEADIKLSGDLAKISRMAVWKKLEAKIENSMNILIESMVARNTVDEEAGGGPSVRLRKVSDDDRRELAADVRALKGLLGAGRGSKGRANRLEITLRGAKADLDSESSRSLAGMEETGGDEETQRA